MTNPLPAPLASSQPLRANRSTGPRTAAGKQRSSQNVVSHGLTSQSPVFATEDPVAYQCHCRQFFDENQPATATETQLTRQLADTPWRLNRVPCSKPPFSTAPPTHPTMRSESISTSSMPTAPSPRSACTLSGSLGSFKRR